MTDTWASAGGGKLGICSSPLDLWKKSKLKKINKYNKYINNKL
jgi:hypothetical protein